MLELGPSFWPIAPKSEGWDASGRPRAEGGAGREVPPGPVVDVSRIEDVDIVWDGAPLDAAVP